MIREYEDFYLIIDGQKGRYTVAAQGPQQISIKPVPFVYELMDNLEEVLQAIEQGYAPAHAAMGQIGTTLFKALMPEPIRIAFYRAQAVLPPKWDLRLRLNIRPAELARLPWELLAHDKAYLAIQRATPIVRFLDNPHPVASLKVDGPLRVLHVQASPINLAPLDLEAGAEILQEALGAQAEIVRLAEATPEQLRITLASQSFHILHFDGHGRFDAFHDQGMLMLMNEQKRAYPLSSSELAAYLSGTEVRFVMLAACQSGQGSSHQPFAGVAQHLMHSSKLPAVVAMQFAISDTAATVFMRGFYGSLAQGIPVDAAMADGRLAILTQINVNQPDWAAPLLLMRTVDGKLWQRPPIKLECPYPGMVPFSEADSPRFYGREHEATLLLEKLRLHPLVTVIGPSGSGKSSLVFAGLIPALRKSGLFGPGKWRVHSMRPGSNPMDRLTNLALTPSTLLASGRPNNGRGEKLLLVVDQFEELFTMAEEEQRRAFLDRLMALVALVALPLVYVVLTVRADFLAELMRSSIWRAIQASRLEVLSLGAEGVRQAIVQPAHDIGGEVDPVLVERLVRDSAGEPGSLPLLQETLVLLWERQEGGYLSVRAYDALGEGKLNGMQIALARHADAALALLTAKQQAIAQRIFVRLVQFGIKREPIRRQQPASLLLSVGDDPFAFEHTLQHLAKRRLLTLSATAEDGERQVDLAHEALISGWPRLQEWLATWQQIEQTRRNLEEKAREWIRLERAGGFLDAAELAEADAWLAEPLAKTVGYSQDVADLVATSRNWVQTLQEQQAAEDERQAVIKRRQRRRQFIIRTALGTLLLVILCTLLKIPPFQQRIGWQEISRLSVGNDAHSLTRVGELLFISTLTSSSDCEGKDTGLWRSIDHGVKWNVIEVPLQVDSLQEDLCRVAMIEALAAVPEQEQILYAVTSEVGLLQSKNAGEDWTQVATEGLPDELKALAIGKKNILVVDNNDILYLSNDGLKWERLNGTKSCQKPTTTLKSLTLTLKVSMLLATSHTFYIGSGDKGGADSGLYASTDGGYCWSRLDDGEARYEYRALKPLPSGSDFLLLTRDWKPLQKENPAYQLWRVDEQGRQTEPLDTFDYLIDALYISPDNMFWYASTPFGKVYKGSIQEPIQKESYLRIYPCLPICNTDLVANFDSPTPLLMAKGGVYRLAKVSWYRYLWP